AVQHATPIERFHAYSMKVGSGLRVAVQRNATSRVSGINRGRQQSAVQSQPYLCAPALDFQLVELVVLISPAESFPQDCRRVADKPHQPLISNLLIDRKTVIVARAGDSKHDADVIIVTR